MILMTSCRTSHQVLVPLCTSTVTSLDLGVGICLFIHRNMSEVIQYVYERIQVLAGIMLDKKAWIRSQSAFQFTKVNELEVRAL